MRFRSEKFALVLLSLALFSFVSPLLAKKKDTNTNPSQNEQRRALQALNRLTFGPRPGDVQRVMSMGVEEWIDRQLHPDRIDNRALEARLASFRTLRMSTKQVAEEFPDGALIKQVMDGKKPMPADAERRAIYQVQIARLEEKQEAKKEAATTADLAASPRKAENAGATGDQKGPMESAVSQGGDKQSGNAPAVADDSASAAADMKSASTANPEARRREEQLYADLEVQKLPDLPADQRFKKILSMPVDELLAFADTLRGGQAAAFLDGMNPAQREALLAMNNPPGVVVDELVQAKLLRAIYSERQLEEVMTDFWLNHFNVFLGKGADRVLLTSYERDVIRPHALGKFEDLLVATAKSPAMLFYLDNWLSMGPNSPQGLGLPARLGRPGPYGRRFPRPNPNAKRKVNNGLNENYGRELLELHTLGVDGGYSQRDVTEAAKVFTGWTIDKPNDGGSFKFDERRHEPGPKFILGHRIKPKGEAEGIELLHRLATSPQTAHFISQKLAQRFVSDDPPPALVDRMTKTFLKKKGDIRQVLAELFHSPEFWSDDAYRAKVKTPLEFVASAARATGAEIEDALPLTRQLSNMGMPLYGAQPPTGYSMKAEKWVSSSALLTRMNFALALTHGKIRGAKVDLARWGNSSPADASGALSVMETSLLAGEVSKQTHDSIAAQIEEGQKKSAKDARPNQARPTDTGTIAGLLLGSPEFQRR
jgi:uncharacterized protein (DUF1800 family)